MKIKARKSDLEIKIISIILFCFSISIFNLAGYILAGLIFIYFIFANRNNIYVDEGMMYLLVYSVMYCISYFYYGNISLNLIVNFLIAPWLLYVFGRDFVLKRDNNENFKLLVKIFVYGFFIHGILNLYTYIQHHGIETLLSSSSYRITYDFWRNEIISVTVCSFYYVPMISFAVGYIFFGKSKTKRCIYFGALLLGLIANLIYSNRTALYIIAILLFAGIMISLFNKNAKVKTWVLFGILSVIIVAVFINDLYGIRTWILNLGVSKRLRGNEVGRMSIWGDFILSDWWLYPFGGYKVGGGYAHNIWLDTLRGVGIIPFVALLCFSFYSVKLVRRLYTSYRIQSLPYIFMLIGIALSFMVEPVIDGNPYYFLLTILIMGGIKGINMKQTLGGKDINLL